MILNSIAAQRITGKARMKALISISSTMPVTKRLGPVGQSWSIQKMLAARFNGSTGQVEISLPERPIRPHTREWLQ